MVACKRITALLWAAAFCDGTAASVAPLRTRSLSPRDAIAGGVDLRIMPVGDSITHGYQGGSINKDGNGYRLQLWNDITANDKQFVGSQTSGNLQYPNNEGYDGAIISEIANNVKGSLGMRPNVVLIHAGTNDMGKSVDPATAPDRLGALIDEVVSVCPDAAVLVAQIIVMSDSGTNARRKTFNAAIPGVVKSRAEAGKNVMVVDMSGLLTTGELVDGLHPTDGGYAKMGNAWFSAIKTAAVKGWIKKPVAQEESSGQTCAHHPSWSPVGQIASGIGNSGKFAANWIPKGQIASGVGSGAGTGDKVRFGDLDGDGRDEYLFVHSDGSVTAFYNVEGGSKDSVSWLPQDVIAAGIGKDGAGVQFADLNGDGRVDYLWVSKTGAVTCYLNEKGSSPGKPNWNPIGEVASGVAPRDRVLFGDMNGDGRNDYLIVGDDGSISVYINTGKGDKISWTSKGKIADGIGDAAGVRIADLNNDGRDDYIWLDSDGSATLYTNTQGTDPDKPQWLPQGKIASGVGANRGSVVFADINGDGKSDYLTVANKTGAVSEWQNGGSGGASEIGPGVLFRDLTGDGRDDYISVDTKGRVTAYFNAGLSKGKPVWLPQGEIASGVGASRGSVRFGDMGGDGKAEYLVVHDDGSVDCWLNAGSGKPVWIPQGQIASGFGQDGAGVVFADLNGDGRDDYLWVSMSGAVTAFLNGGGEPGKPNWLPQGEIASGVGAKRSEVHFADINGDGRVEYIHVDSATGAVNVWFNAGSSKGNNGPDGGKVTWVPWGEVASGVGTTGDHVRFGSLTGTGRADYLAVTNSNGAVDMWKNLCPSPPPVGGDNGGGNGGDNGGDNGGLGGDGGSKETAPLTLDPDSTCNDLEAWQYQHNVDVSTDEWTLTNSSQFFSKWYITNPNAKHDTAHYFASQWGGGDSFRTCTTANFCSAPNCGSLDDPNSKGSGAAHNVMVAISNVNLFFWSIKSAFQYSSTKFASLENAMEQTYYKTGATNLIPLKEVLNAFTAAIGIGAALLGGPAGGIAGALGGAVTGAIGAALNSVDDTLKVLANTEKRQSDAWYNSTLTALNDINDKLMNQGSYSSPPMGENSVVEITTLDDMFQGGTWFNYHNIPVLNGDDRYPRFTENDANAWAWKFFAADYVNYAWTKQNVFVISHEMTEDEFNGREVKAGNDDSRLKLYYGGRGFFFQGFYHNKDIFTRGWYVQNPPGWGNVVDDFGFTTWDVIKSSADSYLANGFNSTASKEFSTYVNAKSTFKDLLTLGPSLPGMFNLPQCLIFNEEMSLEDFFDMLNGPGDLVTRSTSFCWCSQYKKDRFGALFYDQFTEDVAHCYP
ncbi:Fc.00g079460.m01.CDS01 [Cosmosporella sp. VM-42]